MFLKIHKSYRDVIAICDSELIGKVIEEGNTQLDVKENFYKDQEVNEEEAIEILRNFSLEDATFNIVGEQSCEAAIKAGIISEESIGKISGIPFSLVLI